MARLLRIERARAWYRLTTRENEQRPSLFEDRDRRRFRELLSDLAPRFDARVLAYVLLDSHYHLMLVTRGA